MTHVLRARRLLTEEGWLDDHQLRIADGVIAAIEPIPVGVTERDAELLCPAYIDTHVHGGAGVDVMDDAPDVLDKHLQRFRPGHDEVLLHLHRDIRQVEVTAELGAYGGQENADLSHFFPLNFRPSRDHPTWIA